MRAFAYAFAALLCLGAPAHAQSQAASDPAIGLYAFPRGREAYIEYVPDIDGLAVMEFPSGRIRPLRGHGQGVFRFGPTMGAAEPVEATLLANGGRLRWTEDAATQTGRRITFASEPASIASGDVILAGTLTLPLGRGPFPAVVLLHGGGEQTRNFFWVTHFFARRGFAVLAYDKRGVGGSTGNWRSASVHDLAADALAAIDWLRARRDIRTSRIGLYGSSAGGWTAPVVAAAAPDRVAFVIARSASALPERRNVVYEVEGDLRGADYGDDVVAAARALHERDIAVVAANGEGWDDLRAALQAASGEPWFSLVRLPARLIPRTPENEARIARHVAAERRNTIDPPAVWAELRMPVLIQIGARDRYVPGPESAERLRSALAANADAAVILYPTGDHPMFESETGFARDIPNASRYTEGYLGDLDRFVRRMARGD